MVRIIALSCEDCSTVVAGNVLESHREMKCPGLDCKNVLRFSDLPETEQKHMVENLDDYLMED